MSFRKSIFKPSELEKTYSVEIDHQNKEKLDVPMFTVALYETKFMFVEDNKSRDVNGFRFQVIEQSEEQNKDKRKIEISITPNKGNFKLADEAFRKTLSSAHDYRVLYLKDRAEILDKYEDYLIKNNLKVHKAAENRDHSVTFGRGGMVY